MDLLDQQHGEDIERACHQVEVFPRKRSWYNAALLAFLIGPGIIGVAIMGWLKTR